MYFNFISLFIYSPFIFICFSVDLFDYTPSTFSPCHHDNDRLNSTVDTEYTVYFTVENMYVCCFCFCESVSLIIFSDTDTMFCFASPRIMPD